MDLATIITIVFILFMGWSFISFFKLVIRLIAKFGWSPLAQAYPAPPEEELVRDKTWKNFICHVKGAQYKGVVQVSANSNGMILEVKFPLFDSGHAPIFIPWEDLYQDEQKRAFILFIRFHPKKVNIPISLPQKIGQEILDFAPFPLPPVAEMGERSSQEGTSAQSTQNQNESEVPPPPKPRAHDLFANENYKDCPSCGGRVYDYEKTCMCGTKVF